MSVNCPTCSTTNPPSHAFCDQCGGSLQGKGICSLNKSGQVIRANKYFLNMIGSTSDKVTGKPFSLFVALKNLPRFFTHWNELPSLAQPEKLELRLRHPLKNDILVSIEFKKLINPVSKQEQVRLYLTDISQIHIDTNKLEHKELFLDLLITLNKIASSSSSLLADKIAKNILERTCTFIGSERGHVYTFNEQQKSLDTFCKWSQSNQPGSDQKNGSVPFSLIQNHLVALQKKRFHVVENIEKRPVSDKEELFTWQKIQDGSFISQLIIYDNKRVGVICLSCQLIDTDKRGDFLSLLEFTGLLLARSLSEQIKSSTALAKKSAEVVDDVGLIQTSVSNRSTGNSALTDSAGNKCGAEPCQDLLLDDLLIIEEEVSDTGMILSQATSAIEGEVEKLTCVNTEHVPLICSYCSMQTSVPPEKFDELGCYIHVNCPCDNSFSVMREQRRFYRKKVSLKGAFKLRANGQFYMTAADWIPFTMTDLSKRGVRFSSLAMTSIKLGEKLHLKFNLDNNTRTLIKKTAIVHSISKTDIGCKFENNDEHDVALGFYLL